MCLYSLKKNSVFMYISWSGIYLQIFAAMLQCQIECIFPLKKQKERVERIFNCPPPQNNNNSLLLRHFSIVSRAAQNSYDALKHLMASLKMGAGQVKCVSTWNYR